MEPFAPTIDAAKKYVVSSTLEHVDWNAELLHGDLQKADLRTISRRTARMAVRSGEIKNGG